jgi:quercetin dioxygenase-like cupin family protein
MEPVTSLKFPMTFDVARLQADLEKVLKKQWVAHYNTGAYSGNWTSIALLSAGGDSQTINALPTDRQPVTETEVMEGCAYFREVLNGFLFEKTTARLLCLETGAEIKPHRDYCLGYEDGVFRLHIPIVTNPDVEFVLAGERIVMDEGTCWYINANEEHSVANRGTENRIHLVIDGERNEWTDQLFFSLAPEEQFQPKKTEMSDESTQRMIEELERLGTPAALALLKQLKSTD